MRTIEGPIPYRETLSPAGRSIPTACPRAIPISPSVAIETAVRTMMRPSMRSP